MNYRNFITLLIFLVSTLVVKANTNSLDIKIDAPQLSGKKLILCNYYNGNNYVQDSVIISKDGKGSFSKEEPLPQGLYIIVIENSKNFDLLLADDQTFSLSIDTTNFTLKNKIQGSEQSEAFMQYARFIYQKQHERTKIIEEGKALQNQNKDPKPAQDKLDILNGEVEAFQKSFFEKYNGQWIEKFFRGLNPVETGPYPIPKSQEEAIAEFEYQKFHYFDNIDLKDQRFWFTNYFPKKIETYITKQVEQIPDSLANAADRLVAKTLADSTCFKLMLSYLANYSSRSQIMGMENIWAKLAENYYLKGYDTGTDSAFLAKVNSEYRKVRYNRIGMKAHNMDLQDTIGNHVQLYNLGPKYTLICFYEPSCGHCQKVIPQLHDVLFKKYASKGLDVACVYMQTEKNEWMDFIHEHKLEDWNNLWDPERVSYYWQFYDTSTTPSFYLINENKEIIAKKLDVETFDRLLDALFKK